MRVIFVDAGRLWLMTATRPVAVLGGIRIPFARQNTAYATASNHDMLQATLQALAERFSLGGERLGEIGAGAVLKQSRDFNLTREAALGTSIAPETPAYDLQMACGTGLQAIVGIANKIALGQIDSGIGGGVDTTSDAPLALNERFRQFLLALSRAKTFGDRARIAVRFRPGMLSPHIPSNAEPRTGLSMGDHTERMVRQWGITRETQDELAYESHQKAAAAWKEGFYDDLVVPFRGLERDNNLRPDSTLEKLARLSPAYDKTSGTGTLTAGNSTPLTDGASAVLLASDEWAAAHGHEPLAYIVDAETAAVDFVGHPRDGERVGADAEGLLMAPAYAVARLLRRRGLTLQDFDFYEIHEAFAGQVLCTLAAWEDEEYCRTRLGWEGALGSIDRSKLNVKGGSLAAGHPFAATGGRLVAGLAKILHEHGSGRGLISVCAAGGAGIVAILER